MNKNDAKELLQKEKERKEKIKVRMHNYRNNDDYRKKNADYMKDYREKRRKLLEEAKKILSNSENSEKALSKTLQNKINIIKKNHILFSSSELDKQVLINILSNNIEKTYEKYILDNMYYLKNTTELIETFKKKYTVVKTLKTNILPFLHILKKVNKEYFTKLNQVYKSL
jgi:hypothetical protein